MAGKGDKRRPLSVSQKQFEDNWDRAFGVRGKKKIKRRKK
jgi:hypothetical protein